MCTCYFLSETSERSAERLLEVLHYYRSHSEMVLKKYYNHYYPASLANQRALSACCRQGVLLFMVAETKKKRQLGRSFLFGPETCRPKFTCTLLPLTPAAASLPQPRRRLSPADASQPPFSLSLSLSLSCSPIACAAVSPTAAIREQDAGKRCSLH
jgi:hypothetical protein